MRSQILLTKIWQSINKKKKVIYLNHLFRQRRKNYSLKIKKGQYFDS